MATSFGQKLTAATPILTIGVGLIAFVLGVKQWWMVFVIGWLVLTPLVAILFGETSATSHTHEAFDEAIEQRMQQKLESDEDESTTREDALDVLRTRYANGDLNEVEFERMVERLLETESLEDAEAIFDTRFDDAEASLERVDGKRGAEVDVRIKPEKELQPERDDS